MTIVQELMNILKTMPMYIIGLLKDHTILFIVTGVIFIFVTFFSNKIANKLRTIFVLGALLLIVFSFISQSWPRIAFITLGLLVMGICRLIGFALSEIRIISRNKRIEERALEKAAKRRGNWENKRGYSGARRPIIEPEYIPGKMDHEEIDDVINNEFSDEKPVSTVVEEAKQEAAEKIGAFIDEAAEEAKEQEKEESEDVSEEETDETAELPVVEE